MVKKNRKRPVCLIILDGWGTCCELEGNAIYLGNTPNMDEYVGNYPYTELEASGEAVGLPEGQMGNSEVGHLNIGAGRTVYQEYTRINKSISSGQFFENEVLLKAMSQAKKSGKQALHLMGLVSDGGVHSHMGHLEALVKLAASQGISHLYLHAFLDGRDVPPRSAIPYLEQAEQILKQNGIGEIATVSGRYYAMDRDNRWDRTKKAYHTMVYRQGRHYTDYRQVVQDSYNQGKDDEFVIPALIGVHDEDCARIKEGDSIIFFNFRPDRARQLTRSFISEDFELFDRGPNPPQVFFVCLTQYDKNFEAAVAFPQNKIKNTLGEVLAKHSLRQLRIAETEKYAHVTFFFNGGVEKPNPLEDRILIPSPLVATYDLKPEMSAFQVTDTLLEKIEKELYDVIVVNYANPDMVGHTGFLDAAIKAVETVDQCVGRVINKLQEVGGLGIITADHGNVEEMIDPVTGGTVTKHSNSKVPFVICDKSIGKLRENVEPKLCDIAPTLLDILGIEKPADMTGISLLERF
ncbi:MAG: 2,3-bisphosphoglycerate-independent phosphoglycerate mutase [Actinomycetota bacterium]|nr:2,3-bisphosphoglycerate-independent phosphoglycerate mutase [Actinomycetota bacterium]